jgi:coenzyme F420 hydrogenase subunit beta
MGRVADIEFLSAYKIRAIDPNILNGAQDGGATTSILIAGLNAGIIDAAIVVGKDEYWRPNIILARTPEDIRRGSGTKYVYVSTIPKLKEIAQNNDINSVAFINVPCQVKAVSNIIKAGGKLASKVGVRITLFCMHSFTYESLKKLAEEAGVNLDDTIKMDIKGKFIFYTRDGEKSEVPIAKAEEYIRPPCKKCKDFIYHESDLAIGSIGTPRGWNTVLVLSDKGKKLVEAAISQGLIEAESLSEKGVSIVEKFIKRKREEAEN